MTLSPDFRPKLLANSGVLVSFGKPFSLTPHFLKLQFTRNNHHTKLILLQDSSFLSIDFRKKLNNSSDPIAIYETLSYKTRNVGYTIGGSCNGLLLLYDYWKLDLSITNPITHESRQLPPVPKSIRRGFSKFGFGYCSNDDEYTVVLISDYTCISPVYMLKKNLWKRVDNSPLRIDSDCGAFMNGAIHWLCSGMIYAFDLDGERFRKMEQPEGLKNEDGYVVAILGGCLCLVVRHKTLATYIWVMKEYGVRKSWTKYLACYSGYRYILPLFFWNGDESIVAVVAGRFVLCSLKQETLASILVIGERSSKDIYHGMWTFVDSLISPNSINAGEGLDRI